jgi:hypothetical protein
MQNIETIVETLVYICLYVTWLKRPKCAWHDFVVHQRMNTNSLLPYDLFSWNKAKQDGEILQYGDTEHYYYLHTKWQLFTVITYSVHDGYSLSCQTLLLIFLDAPWEFCPLLCCWSTAYLAPAWRARPSLIPPSQIDPISLRVQAPSRFFIGYTKLEQLALYSLC